MNHSTIMVLGAFTLMGMAHSAFAAFEFKGDKTIIAVTADGAKTTIGTVQFTPAADQTSTFKFTLKTSAFTDYFLSMREFKCLAASKEVSCYVPYPYEHPATVSPDNLAWLEHSLLFLHKSPSEFGAKLHNGTYYELAEQGNTLVGTPKAIDLNVIAAPPSDTTEPPFAADLRYDMEAQERWITQLLIE